MRRVFAVLVLAAVVSMHGIPALGADGEGHRDTVVEMAVAAPSGLTGAHALDQPSAVDRSGLPPAAPVPPGHGVDSHVWAACLAVLLALTLLAAAVQMGRRGRPLLRGPTVRRLSGWKVPPRPPDLFALCLLRT